MAPTRSAFSEKPHSTPANCARNRLRKVLADRRRSGTIRGVPQAVSDASGGKSGDLPGDLDAFDLLRALIGVSHVGSGADWQQSARRLEDILIAGSRSLK
jgi:hypothetical protein